MQKKFVINNKGQEIRFSSGIFSVIYRLLLLDDGEYDVRTFHMVKYYPLDQVVEYLKIVRDVRIYDEHYDFDSNFEINESVKKAIKNAPPIDITNDLRLIVHFNNFLLSLTGAQKVALHLFVQLDSYNPLNVPDGFKDGSFFAEINNFYQVLSEGKLQLLEKGIEIGAKLCEIMSQLSFGKIDLKTAEIVIKNRNLDITSVETAVKKPVFAIQKAFEGEKFYDYDYINEENNSSDDFFNDLAMHYVSYLVFGVIKDTFEKITYNRILKVSSDSPMRDNATTDNFLHQMISTLYNYFSKKDVDCIEIKKNLLEFVKSVLLERTLPEERVGLKEGLDYTVSYFNSCDERLFWNNFRMQNEYWSSIQNRIELKKFWKALYEIVLEYGKVKNLFLNSNGDIDKKGQVFFANINFRLTNIIDKKKEYKNWYDFNFDRLYSTHAWIAHISILIIKNNPQLKEKWNRLINGEFWTEERIKLYLYATAAPDYPDFVKLEGLSNNFFNDKFHLMRIDKKGNKIKTLDYIFPRSIYGKIKIGRINGEFKYDCADMCRILGIQSLEYLKYRQYDYAVFRLGNLAHFLGDCACFPHLFDFMNDDVFLKKIEDKLKKLKKIEEATTLYNSNINRDYYSLIHEEFNVKIHSHYQNMISERTDGRQGGIWSSQYVLNSKWSEQFLFDFFKVDFDYIYNKLTPISPEKAALNTARFTYFDSDNNLNDSAPYMCNNYLDTIARDWKEIPKDWQIWSPLSDKDKLTKIFLIKIQKSLQEAILNLINCLTYIIET